MPRARTENTKKQSQERGTAWEPEEKDGEPPFFQDILLPRFRLNLDRRGAEEWKK